MKCTILHSMQKPTSKGEITAIEWQELEAARDRARVEIIAAEDRVSAMEGKLDRAIEEKQAAEKKSSEVVSMMRVLEGERDRAIEEKQEIEERASAMEVEKDMVREEKQAANEKIS